MSKALKEPGGVAALVEKLVRPAVEGLGLRLWDVRFEKEGSLWFLKILVDRDEPMDTDTCEVVSRALDPILDEADPISQSYYLEVGSPGLGRRLTRPFHFEELCGQKIRASLYAPLNGQKDWSGILKGLQGDEVVLETETEEVRLPVSAASGFWLCDDEGLFNSK